MRILFGRAKTDLTQQKLAGSKVRWSKSAGPIANTAVDGLKSLLELLGIELVVSCCLSVPLGVDFEDQSKADDVEVVKL